MLKRACDYTYLNQSDCLEIHGVDDGQNFSTLMVICQNQSTNRNVVYGVRIRLVLAIFLPLPNILAFDLKSFELFFLGKNSESGLKKITSN